MCEHLSVRGNAEEQGLITTLHRRVQGKTPRQVVEAIVATLKQPFREMRGAKDDFDARWGTETTRLVATSDLEFSREEAGYCCEYQASGSQALDNVVAQAGIDPAEYAMIDVGSGKGRVVLVAAARPFRRAIGVEYSRKLHDIAENNARIFTANGGAKIAPEFVCSDATEYAWPDGPLLVYLYNPFGPPLLDSFAEGLIEEHARNPRPVVLAYVNPKHRRSFDMRPAYALDSESEDILVYKVDSARR